MAMVVIVAGADVPPVVVEDEPPVPDVTAPPAPADPVGPEPPPPVVIDPVVGDFGAVVASSPPHAHAARTTKGRGRQRRDHRRPAEKARKGRL
jgi:hypothetical protein